MGYIPYDNFIYKPYIYFHQSIYDNQLATYLPNYNKRKKFSFLTTATTTTKEKTLKRHAYG